MKKNILFIMTILLSTTLMAYSDSDLDGVDDKVDKCPGTSLSELVDITGCPKQSLISPHHYDIVLGLNYSDADYTGLQRASTLSTSFQVDYFYKNFSLQASTSFYNTTANGGYSDSGMYDSYVGAAYQVKPFDALSIRIGAGAILPTYDTTSNNNNTDYSGSVNVTYALSKNFNIFAGYIYTIINDDDYNDGTTTYIYQDTNAYTTGLGFYVSPKLYIGGAYNSSESIYEGYEDIQTASLYLYHSVNKHVFTTFSYVKGLSDTATNNYFSVRLGYYF
ncbi:transporter [Sulfurimonas sp.]